MLIHLKGIYVLLERGKLALLRHETGILAAGDNFSLLPAPAVYGDFPAPPEQAARGRESFGCPHAGEADSFSLLG